MVLEDTIITSEKQKKKMEKELKSKQKEMAKQENTAQSFYQTYFTDILQHLFSVITDSSHTAGMLYPPWSTV